MTGRKNALATEVLDQLLEGNERFRTGRSLNRRYEEEGIARLAVEPKPIACIIACGDSRVSPEIVFDQPLGNLFTARIPGNVCADSGRWSIDIAVKNLKVPLVMVMGHTGCLAITQVVNGETGEGGPLRLSIMSAVWRAKMLSPDDLLMASIEENAKLALEKYEQESWTLRHALNDGVCGAVAALYDVHTGRVSVIPGTQTWS